MFLVSKFIFKNKFYCILQQIKIDNIIISSIFNTNYFLSISYFINHFIT